MLLFIFLISHRKHQIHREKHQMHRKILDSLPQVDTPDLLRFFHHLLGAAAFDVLCEDLRAKAEISLLRCRQRSSSSEIPPTNQATSTINTQSLIDAFQDVVEHHARNHTAFERRHRVRKLANTAMQADSSMLAQVFYEHLEPDELEAWSQKLHSLGREDLWRPF